MEPTSLSLLARALRTRLAQALGIDVGQVHIGHPQAASKAAAATASGHGLNLFLYRVEAGAYPAAGNPQDPLFLRVHCLITPFAEAETGTSGASAGENDLRLIDLVAQALHRQPMLDLYGDDQRPVAQVQVVPVPLSLDDINHLWATQPETPYRLSLAYELALVPLPLARAVDRAPKVGAVGVGVSPGAVEKPVAVAFSVPRLVVNAQAAGWAPQCAFLDRDGHLLMAVALDRAAGIAQLSLVAAGDPGTQASVVWEQWTAAGGWAPLDAAMAPASLQIESARIEAGAGLVGTALTLPANPPPQLQVHLERDWQRPDGRSQAVASNPLLISFHGGAVQ